MILFNDLNQTIDFDIVLNMGEIYLMNLVNIIGV
jgi:hypothetical protein